eukprot:gene21993-28082_t
MLRLTSVMDSLKTKEKEFILKFVGGERSADSSASSTVAHPKLTITPPKDLSMSFPSHHPPPKNTVRALATPVQQSPQDTFKTPVSSILVKKKSNFTSPSSLVDLFQQLKSTKDTGDVQSFVTLLRDNKFSPDTTFKVDSFYPLFTLEWIAAMNATQLNSVLMGLSRLGLDCSRDKECFVLCETIFHRMFSSEDSVDDRATRSVLPSVLLNFSKLNLNQNTLSSKEWNTLQRQIALSTESLNGKSLSTVFSALHRMNVDWKVLSSDTQNALLSRLSELNASMEPGSRSIAIMSLSSMGLELTSCANDVKNTLFDTMTTTFTTCDSAADGGRNLTTTLSSLMKMGATLKTISDKCKVALFEALARSGKDLDVMSTAVTIKTLGEMDVMWSELPPTVTSALQLACSKNLSSLEFRYIAQIVYGLSAMNAEWSELSSNLKQELIGECAVALSKSNCDLRDAADTMKSLGKMDVQWSVLPHDFTSAVANVCASRIQTIAPRGLTGILFGLSGMKAKWSELSPECTTGLEDACGALLGRMTHVEILETVYSLAAMSAGDLQKDTSHRNLEVNIEHFSEPQQQIVYNLAGSVLSSDMEGMSRTEISQQGASTLSGLAGMRVVYKDTPEALQKAVMQCIDNKLSSFDDQALCGSMHSLAGMGLCWKDLPTESQNAVISAIVAALPSMSLYNALSTIAALSSLEVVWSDMPSSLQNVVIDALVSHAPSLSVKQTSSVLFNLCRLDINALECSPVLTKLLLDMTLRALSLVTSEDDAHQGRQFPATLLSLAEFGLSSGDLPDVLRDVIAQWLEFNLHIMEPTTVAKTLFGLGSLKVNWSGLPQEAVTSLLSAFTDALPDLTVTDLIKALDGLGDTGAQYSELSLLELTAAVWRLAPKMTASQLSEVLSSFVDLNATWDTLAPEMRWALCERFVERIHLISTE